MNHSSWFELVSQTAPGVVVRLRRISFGGRLQLARILGGQLDRLDEALQRQAGGHDTEAALLAAEADVACARWAIVSITGLDVDGEPATADSLLDRGPEELVHEVIAALRAEIGLTEAERKNSESPSTSCEAGPRGPASGGSATPASGSDWNARATAVAARNPSIPAATELSGCGAAVPRENRVTISF